MRKLGHMLGDAIERGEVIRAARAQSVMRDWTDIVGLGLAEKSCPDRYDKGTVWVAVQGSAWAQELRMMKGQILEKLNARAREPDLFVDVRFGVRPVRPLEPIIEPAEPPPPRDPSLESLTIKEIAERRLRSWSDEGRTQP